MDKLGLSPSDFAAYRRVFTLPSAVRQIRLDVLDLGTGKHLRSLTPKVIDGSVTGDTTTGDVSRILDTQFWDPGNNLGFDPGDPSAAPIHRSRLLRVWDCRLVEELDAWVNCPVFTGPVWDFDRTGSQIDVTAHGMEAQALGQLGQTYHAPAKKKLTDVIRDLLALVGDVNANVPDLPHTLPHALDLHDMDQAWLHIKKLAASLNRFPMYDGMGRFHLRPYSRRGVYRFHKTLASDVTVKRSTDSIINTVIVIGPKPHGPHKTRIRAKAVLTGPLSPANLGRNGVPLHLIKKVERDHLKSHAQAQAIADRILRDVAQTRTDLSWEAVPLPFLEERDRLAVVDDAFGTAHIRLRQWTLPLGGSDVGGTTGTNMTVGSKKMVRKVKLR